MWLGNPLRKRFPLRRRLGRRAGWVVHRDSVASAITEVSGVNQSRAGRIQFCHIHSAVGGVNSGVLERTTGDWKSGGRITGDIGVARAINGNRIQVCVARAEEC